MELEKEKFVKFFPSNMTINNFKYKIGLNINDHEDMSYLKFDNLFYSNINKDLIGILRIPKKDIKRNFMASPEIYIDDIYPFESFLKDKKICPEEKKLIQCPILKFRMIDNPSEEIQLEYIQKNGFIICFIENPTEVVQLAAIYRNYLSINHIKNISEEVLIKAINKDWWCILYIEFPSIKVQFAAINKNIEAIKYMPNISKKDRDNLLYYIKTSNQKSQVISDESSSFSSNIKFSNITSNEEKSFPVVSLIPENQRRNYLVY